MLKAQSGIPARAPRQTLNGPQPGTKQRRGVNSDGPAILPHFHDARMAGHGPGNFESFVREVAEPAPGEELPPAGRPHDPAVLAQAAAKVGIEILGPPGALPAG